ncbi:MAG: polyprenyl synthetase family protein [Dermatophilaceae bacterium]|jgi:heptaprenyl diphosphate synthase|nr:polyprenyl synthetase family protein [Dermatophilaceae bacterium]MBP9918751.1 polyprenyl synthetase family protein [Dermatophilaceae bacterium]
MSAPSVLTLPGVSPGLAAQLADGMARVDDLLRHTVDHDDPYVSAASGHLLAAGGKRFRPTLTILAALACGELTDEVITAAVGVELTHLASLYHDDVMDEAAVRRGVPSVNAAYDNSTAILVGDLLFGKASELIAGLGPEAVLIQAQTFVRLCEGQIRDTLPCPPDADPIAYYLRVLADKTGVLVATAARYGAMFGGGGPEQVEVLRTYGERLGMAFQLADDLIDIASDGSVSGKTPGTDLREGVDTLAVLYVKASSNPADPADARLLELLDTDLGHDEAGVHEALTLLRAHPALAQAKARTREVGDDALAALSGLPPSDARVALATLVEQVIDRVG